MGQEYIRDIERIQNISVVPTILNLICQTTKMRNAAVARVTSDRWLACQRLDVPTDTLQGGMQLDVDTTICQEVCRTREVVAFDDASTDPVYAHHPSPGLHNLRSFISAPIILADGSVFGTLCASDIEALPVNNAQTIDTFKLFADLVGRHIDVADRLATTEARLDEERKEAELREMFVAVLGHDLRSPLAAIDAGADRLLRNGVTEQSPHLLQLMKGSVARMANLVDNLLDFARVRLGSGMQFAHDPSRQIDDTLRQIVAETQLAHPEREIILNLPDIADIAVDHGRIGQLLSNLLSNAITHGGKDSPISVTAFVQNGSFELSVVNHGQMIDVDHQPNLFKPFFRGTGKSAGLGLGLYIANEIALLHGGTLTVKSCDQGTKFTFAMPVVSG